MQLTNILDVKATLRCLSGLHIGAGDTEMHIGGIDNTVVRNPITQRPYIPGSSLKGKVRSLLEWRSGFVQENPLGWADYERTKSDEVLAILRLFGAGGGDQLTLEQARLVGPSRVSFWDVAINDKWISEVEEDNLLRRSPRTRSTASAAPRRIRATPSAWSQARPLTSGSPSRCSIPTARSFSERSSRASSFLSSTASAARARAATARCASRA